LDMESIEVLCKEIKKFQGSSFIVTHSELLLRELCTHLIIFKDGQATYFEGGYERFLQKVGWDDDFLPKKEKKEKGQKVKPKAAPPQNTQKIEAEMAQIEEDIIKLEEMIEKYEGLCQEKSLNGEDIRDVSEVLGKLHKKVEEKFAQMTELENQSI